MDRLTPLDDTFIVIERTELPMHIGSLMIFEGPCPDYEVMLAAIRGRLDVIPRYRQRIRSVPLNLGYPVWLDDPNFQLEYHVRHTALPAPGDDAKLRSLAARLLSHRLDMARPPWELWIIEDLSNNRFAMLNKVHHSMADGLSGSDMISLLLDESPSPPAIRDSQWRPAAEPSTARMVAAGLLDDLKQPARRVADLAAHARKPRDAIRRTLTAGLGALRLGNVVSHQEHYLMGSPGPHIRWAWAKGDLAEVKDIKTKLGGTVNDVILAAVTGGYRGLLLSRGERLRTSDTIRTMIPVSTRSPDSGDSGNAVAVMFADLPIGLPDVRARYSKLRSELSGAKHSGQAEGTDALLENAVLLPAMLFAVAGRLASRMPQPAVATVTTNVPGPQKPLYMQGRLMKDLFPYVPLGMNQLTTVAIMSYNGEINCGVTADYDEVPDVDVIAEGIETSLAELADLAATSR